MASPLKKEKWAIDNKQEWMALVRLQDPDDQQEMKMYHLNWDLIVVNEDPFMIGRKVEGNGKIISVYISRVHCTFSKNTSGNWLVTNTSSVGTRVNSVTMKMDERRLISIGDTLQFGENKFFQYQFRPFEGEIVLKRMKLDEIIAEMSNVEIIKNIRVNCEGEYEQFSKELETLSLEEKQLQEKEMYLKAELQAIQEKKKLIDQKVNEKHEDIKYAKARIGDRLQSITNKLELLASSKRTCGKMTEREEQVRNQVEENYENESRHFHNLIGRWSSKINSRQLEPAIKKVKEENEN